MHAHIEWESQDCDGRMSGTYAMHMTPEEQASDLGILEFQHRVLSSVVSVTSPHGTLTVSDAGDGTTRFDWSETTEEGGRSVEATFWDGSDCTDPDHAATWRDHQAEAAGY